MIERLDFSDNTSYNATEACIHLNRYAFIRPFCEKAAILDAACGEGYGSYLMKTWGAKSVTGIDIDEETIARAKKLFSADGVQFMVHTVEQLPFEDAVFDVVVSFETIEHVDDPDAFLKEIKRVLKPGGTVIMSCPNDIYYYQNDCQKNPFHKREYTYFQFKDLAEKYLGAAAGYYFGFALDGFVNLPMDKCTEPEISEQENALGLLHYESCGSALCVPQERYLNKWNANYYIGVWTNSANTYRISTVLAPRETFIEHKDKDFDFFEHVAQLRKELQSQTDMRSKLEGRLLQVYGANDLLKQENAAQGAKILEQESEITEKSEALNAAEKECSQLQERIEQLDIKLGGLGMSNARLTELLDLTRKERNNLQQQFEEEKTQLQERIEQLDIKLGGLGMSNARLTELLDLTRKERDQLQEYAANVAGNLAQIQSERDYFRQRVNDYESSRIVRFAAWISSKLYALRQKLKKRS